MVISTFFERPLRLPVEPPSAYRLCSAATETLCESLSPKKHIRPKGVSRCSLVERQSWSSSAPKIEVEQGLGTTLNYADRDYESAGAKISRDRLRSLAEADMLLRLQKPPLNEIDILRKGCIHASFLNPFNERELVLRLAAAEVTAVSMEMIPRTTVAQKMDVLSCASKPGRLRGSNPGSNSH